MRPQLLKNQVAIGIALLAFMGVAFNIWLAVESKDGWGLDFNQFYAASRLAGTGHLYDWDALRKIEVENGYQVPTARLPVVIYLHKLLAFLPYRRALCLWLALSLAALLVSAFIWPGASPRFMLLALAWSAPAALVLVYGQDDPFWLLFFAAGLMLMERKKPWLAGIAFSLCICKFHLATGIPILLLARRQWNTLVAGAAALGFWIASSFLIEGAHWPFDYVKITQMPAFSPASERMPNLHGLASWLPWTNAVEIASAAAIVLLLWSVCRDTRSLGMAGAAAAACGVLIGHHSYAGDTTVLIPLAVLTLQRQATPQGIRVWTFLLLSPVTLLLLTSDHPVVGQLLVVGFVVTAVLLLRERPAEQPAPAPGLAVAGV